MHKIIAITYLLYEYTDEDLEHDDCIDFKTYRLNKSNACESPEYVDLVCNV